MVGSPQSTNHASFPTHKSSSFRIEKRLLVRQVPMSLILQILSVETAMSLCICRRNLKMLILYRDYFYYHKRRLSPKALKIFSGRWSFPETWGPAAPQRAACSPWNNTTVSPSPPVQLSTAKRLPLSATSIFTTCTAGRSGAAQICERVAAQRPQFSSSLCF